MHLLGYQSSNIASPQVTAANLNLFTPVDSSPNGCLSNLTPLIQLVLSHCLDTVTKIDGNHLYDYC
jgi:hypothetical protein